MCCWVLVFYLQTDFPCSTFDSVSGMKKTVSGIVRAHAVPHGDMAVVLLCREWTRRPVWVAQSHALNCLAPCLRWLQRANRPRLASIWGQTMTSEFVFISVCSCHYLNVLVSTHSCTPSSFKVALAAISALFSFTSSAVVVISPIRFSSVQHHIESRWHALWWYFAPFFLFPSGKQLHNACRTHWAPVTC